MSYRDHMLTVMLWLAIIGMGSWAGGTLYQMVEVVPVWSASPPESVRTLFRDTDFGRHKVRFFGPATMVARNLPLILALVAACPDPGIGHGCSWRLAASPSASFSLSPTSTRSTRFSSTKPEVRLLTARLDRWSHVGSWPIASVSASAWSASLRSCRRFACPSGRLRRYLRQPAVCLSVVSCYRKSGAGTRHRYPKDFLP
jgi:hypothetical protein